MSRQKIKVRSIAFTFLLITVLFLLFNFKDLSYGVSQLVGQIKILSNTQKVEEVLNSEDFPDSLKVKLLLIDDIRHFAIHDLGLKDSKNYRTIFDQKGKDILWIVTACPPFEMKAYEWKFALFGNFPYKGFFSLSKTEAEKEKMLQKGYEADIRRVNAWSTLGWFEDPILSNMLYRNEGDLANLIIHELTHATLFVKNDIDLNENLASFVGDYGAQLYLEKKYGSENPITLTYKNELKEEKYFISKVISQAQNLDSLYSSFNHESIEEKERMKENHIRKWLDEIDSVTFPTYQNFKNRSALNLPNNTFFMSYLRYNKMQNSFEAEFDSKYRGNLKSYLKYLFEKYEKDKSWYDF